MPKVTEEHKAARRTQILEATLRCVAAEGFHKTTMAAVIRESGLSAGAVYMYFRSKKDLIYAIAEHGVTGVAAKIAEYAEADDVPPPEDVLAGAAQGLLDVGRALGVEFPGLALQLWAEAARDEEVRAVLGGEAARIRASWVSYVTRAIEVGHIAGDSDPEVVGTTLMGMLPGFIVLRVVYGVIKPADYAAGLAALRR